MDKKRKIVVIVLISLFLLGTILMLIGFYYWIVKAGIPYQDPTPEMLQRYYRDMKIGDITLLTGLGIVIMDSIGAVFCYFKFWKKQTKKDK